MSEPLRQGQWGPHLSLSNTAALLNWRVQAEAQAQEGGASATSVSEQQDSTNVRGAIAQRRPPWGAHMSNRSQGLGRKQPLPGTAVRAALFLTLCTPARALLRCSDKTPAALFFRYNTQLGPPYQVLIDTNFINFTIRNKVLLLAAVLPGKAVR